MYIFLLTLLVIDGLLLSLVVLLQAGQGGGLASLGGGTTDKVLGGRQASNFLTQASWSLGAGLLVLSLMLSIVAGRQGGGLTDVQRQLQTGPQTAPQVPLNLEGAPPPAPTPPPDGTP